MRQSLFLISTCDIGENEPCPEICNIAIRQNRHATLGNSLQGPQYRLECPHIPRQVYLGAPAPCLPPPPQPPTPSHPPINPPPLSGQTKPRWRQKVPSLPLGFRRMRGHAIAAAAKNSGSDMATFHVRRL